MPIAGLASSESVFVSAAAVRFAKACGRRLVQTAGKRSKAAHAVIHDDSPCHGDIDAESGRNFDDVVAARENLVRKHAKLGPKHIGRVKRMTEGRQVGCALYQLDPDKLAPKRQYHLPGIGPAIDGQVEASLGGVAWRFEGVWMSADREKELCTERVRRAQQVAQIHGFRYPFGSDGKVTAHACAFSRRLRAFPLR